MKNRFLVLIFIIVTIIFSACTAENSSEELQEIDFSSSSTIENTTGSNQLLDISNENLNINSTTELNVKENDPIPSSFDDDNFIGVPLGGGCPSWTPPFVQPGETGLLLHVYYNPNLVPLDQINCVRQDYSQQFCNLRFVAANPGDPYHDIWTFVSDLNCSIGPSAGKDSAETATQTDPRVCARNPCQ